MNKIEKLKTEVEALLQSKLQNASIDNNELTIVVNPTDLIIVMQQLRDSETTQFEQCVDLCGVDYSEFHNYNGPRFAIVYHLLSVKHNWRLRVRSFASNENFPVMPSLIEVWSGLNWLEREVFDLFGIIFENHPDLRRILTDYGFVGHPFRKDFPLSGFVEMRYDEEQKRVVYQPVTIEPREITPRVVREDSYCGGN